jgi:hypothetical protein
MHHLSALCLRPAALSIAAVLACGPALAQDVYCLRQGQVDQQTTLQLRQLIQNPDPRIMGLMAGTWYSETYTRNQVSYLYSTYEPNGLWSYQNRVCGGLANTCSDYQGTGMFGGVALAGGLISLVIAYSDLNVSHACTGSVVQPLPDGTLRDSNGGIWRKVR